MEIRVLFNSLSNAERLSVGWGLSFLIDNRIIFDTGEKGDLLANNINKLNIDLSLVEAVVISHDHWDHTGGLWEVLKHRPGIRVYGCPEFGSDFKCKISGSSAKYFESKSFTRVDTGIYSTGEIFGIYKGANISEQSLIIKTEKGFSIVTGCAHPGIIKIIEKVKAQLSIRGFYAVIGGFHLKDSSTKEIEQIVEKFRELKVKRVGATHCSGTEAENLFRQEYKDDFFSLKVGEIINV